VDSASRTAVIPDGPHGGESLIAYWEFPASPPIRIERDGTTIAGINYLPASASYHWYLALSGAEDLGADGVPLTALVSRVPEEVDADRDLCAATLGAALEAILTAMLGRPVPVETVER
jgi:hypothetical protein